MEHLASSSSFTPYAPLSYLTPPAPTICPPISEVWVVQQHHIGTLEKNLNLKKFTKFDDYFDNLPNGSYKCENFSVYKELIRLIRKRTESDQSLADRMLGIFKIVFGLPDKNPLFSPEEIQEAKELLTLTENLAFLPRQMPNDEGTEGPRLGVVIPKTLLTSSSKVFERKFNVNMKDSKDRYIETALTFEDLMVYKTFLETGKVNLNSNNNLNELRQFAHYYQDTGFEEALLDAYLNFFLEKENHTPANLGEEEIEFLDKNSLEFTKRYFEEYTQDITTLSFDHYVNLFSDGNHHILRILSKHLRNLTNVNDPTLFAMTPEEFRRSILRINLTTPLSTEGMDFVLTMFPNLEYARGRGCDYFVRLAKIKRISPTELTIPVILADLESLINKYPQWPHAYVCRALVYQQMWQNEQNSPPLLPVEDEKPNYYSLAINDFTLGLKLAPRGECHNFLAEFLMLKPPSEQDFKTIMAHLRLASKLNPNLTETTVISRIKQNFKKKKWKKIDRLFSRLPLLNAELFFIRGKTHHKLFEWELAENSYYTCLKLSNNDKKRLSELSPKNATIAQRIKAVYENLGKMFFALRSFDKANAYFQSAFEDNKANVNVKYPQSLMIGKMDNGKIEKIKEILNNLIKSLQDSESPKDKKHLSEAYAVLAAIQENINDKIDLCNTALIHNRNCFIAHLILGRILLRNGERDQAIEHFKCALPIQYSDQSSNWIEEIKNYFEQLHPFDNTKRLKATYVSIHLRKALGATSSLPEQKQITDIEEATSSLPEQERIIDIEEATSSIAPPKRKAPNELKPNASKRPKEEEY